MVLMIGFFQIFGIQLHILGILNFLAVESHKQRRSFRKNKYAVASRLGKSYSQFSYIEYTEGDKQGQRTSRQENMLLAIVNFYVGLPASHFLSLIQTLT